MKRIWLLAFLICSPLWATTYYVDNCVVIGSDANNGTSSTTPWLTINKVNTSTFNPGDSILFESTCTWREQLTVPSSGSAGSPITIGSYGSGAKPIIDGANVVASSSWTATTTQTITGSVSQANMKLSLASGTAFVDFNASGQLTPYVGDQITIKDSSSHQLVGYIKAAGSVETYGSQLLSNTGLTATTSLNTNNATLSIVASGGQSGGAYLKVTLTSAYGGGLQSFNVSSGMLLKSSAYLEKGTETSGMWLCLDNSGWSSVACTAEVLPSSWTQYTVYGTVNSGGTTFEQFYNGATSGQTSFFDGPATTTQVLTPSATGVTIVSAAGGSSYNWTSEQSGFNRNDSNYTYSIVASTTVYYTPEPSTSTLGLGSFQVFEDGTRLTQESSGTSSLAPGQWYLNTTSSQIWVYTLAGDNPSGHTMEVSVRQQCIGNYLDYVAVQNLTVENGAWSGVVFDNYSEAIHYVSITGITAEHNYGGGITVYDTGGGYSMSNVTISGNTTTGNGGAGIDMWTDGDTFTNVSITGNIGHDDIWNPAYAPASPNGEIHIFGQNMNGLVIKNNLAYNSGSALPDFKAYPNVYDIGSGIYVDTVPSNAVIAYNEVYNNNDSGIILEDTQGAAVYGNVSYDNGVAGFTNVRLSSNNLWYNNTAYGNALGFQIWASTPTAGGIIDNQFKNNIAAGSTVSALQATGGGENDGTNGYGNVYSYNDFGAQASNFITWGASSYSTYSSWETATGSCGTTGCSHSTQTNPTFYNATAEQLWLTAGSPGIAAGTALGSPYNVGIYPGSSWPNSVFLVPNLNNDLGAFVYTGYAIDSVMGSGTTASGTMK